MQNIYFQIFKALRLAETVIWHGVIIPWYLFQVYLENYFKSGLTNLSAAQLMNGDT
jgi:hypothetical protein